MKKHLISTITVLVVLALVLVAFGQEEGSRRGRGGFMGREERLKSIKAIEEQLAKLKEEGQRPAFDRESFQNMSEEERTKYREQRMKVSQERQRTLQTIIAQVARIQGRRQPPVEGERFLILSTNDLKPIQASATKEKAKETAQLLERLIARGSGRAFGGRRPRSGQRPQGGARGGQ